MVLQCQTNTISTSAKVAVVVAVAAREEVPAVVREEAAALATEEAALAAGQTRTPAASRPEAPAPSLASVVVSTMAEEPRYHSLLAIVPATVLD